MNTRLFIVSSRLPITIDADGNVVASSGGLVTAVRSYLEKDNLRFTEVAWCGIPGCDLATWVAAEKKLDSRKFVYLPVFESGQGYDAYYNGFSNSVLWPLFHYFPSYAEFDVENYDQYMRVNRNFAETLLHTLRPGDHIWIHDYHLLPLSAMIRKEIPDITIGFFLHIPFPSYEIFRLIPRKWQQQLLKGMMGADLVGFHTMDYATHFLHSVLMVCGLDSDRNIIHYDNRLIKVDVFPISIDYKKFSESYHDKTVCTHRRTLLEQMKGRKLIFSVDRLDYTKGVQNRLKAYERFLLKNPAYYYNVVFIMVIVPSRDAIPKYAERKRSIDELISQINSRIGNMQWMPVIYQYNSLRFEEMLGLFTASDMALITPLRDGMNLVSKEFIASRQDKKGVLVLSEMAGASRELTDALIINPNDINEMADKIKEGLEMDKQKQKDSIEKMQKRIENYDVNAWADDFMCELFNIKNKQASYQIKFLDEFTRRKLLDAYRNSSKRLLLLDYDGTLVPFSAYPEMAVPDGALIQLIGHLSNCQQNDVFLISGRDSDWLQQHFGNLPINLIAEHGAKYKYKGKDWETDVQTHSEWKGPVHSIMEMFVRRCANSMVEEKDFSMVWHYRNSNVEQAKLRSAELICELNEHVRNRHLQVLPGNKIIEVRQSGINKGNFLKKILSEHSYDFIFAAGDDRTDEDMFRELISEKNSFTIKVGPEASFAKYNLYTSQMVISLLHALAFLNVTKGIGI